MSLSAIQTRLSGQVAGFAGRVSVARDIDRAVEQASSVAGDVPSAVIFNPVEKAGPNSMKIGRNVDQVITVSFSILTCVRYSGNSAKAFDELDSLIDDVRGAIVGWTGLNTDGLPVEYVGGEVAFSDVGLVIWRDEFRYTYTMRSIT